MNVTAESLELHPLDPCSADELSSSVKILRDSGNLSEDTMFSCGYAAEPAKDLVLGFETGASFDRIVRLIGHDRVQGQSFDARVSLTNSQVTAFAWIDDGQAPINSSDYRKLLEVLAANDEWVAALEKRGIEVFSLPGLAHRK